MDELASWTFFITRINGQFTAQVFAFGRQGHDQEKLKDKTVMQEMPTNWEDKPHETTRN